ncbi:hypothetical protein OG244_35300 [Streptomyces brevispora]|uniref:hypothetical protein n=1 Tax=Streptomyces brevispora TaxID=887462 RepID=UPI002E33B522|nr:hypothetical protein [Streptomyces brevispora]
MQQLRGWSCLWCAAEVATGTATNLGEQQHKPADGSPYWWFPRACPDTTACARRAAGAGP